MRKLFLDGGSARLNLFYEEADLDRWIPFDRYPRRGVRRAIRGKPRIGGQRRLFLNLCAGLHNIGVSYRTNAYRHIRKHPEELACIVGKSYVLDKLAWRNPILFGAATFSHPIEKLDLLVEYPTVKKILVPSEWMRKMWAPYYGNAVTAWPVGINTHAWVPTDRPKSLDLLIYDKIMWQREERVGEVLVPIREELSKRNLRFSELRYGKYREEDYRAELSRCRAMIFLCEHETQGIAYQQALSAAVPILAWDRSGFWEDPAFFPHQIRYGPVSSVPYWDERCGIKFASADEFGDKLDEFMDRMSRGAFSPRDYIVENLTLEKCASRYVAIFNDVASEAQEAG